jgi:hypothetical protein
MMELREVSVARMESDLATAPTYGTGVRLDAAVKLTVQPKTESKELNGDSVLQDVYARTTAVDLDIEVGLLSLDGYQIMVGGSVTTTGTTPNQKVVYSLKASDWSPPYFKLEGRWTYAGVGIGDAHVILYKCKVTDAPAIELNDASGNFGTVKFKASALPATADGSWFDIVLNETAVENAE